MAEAEALGLPWGRCSWMEEHMKHYWFRDKDGFGMFCPGIGVQIDKELISNDADLERIAELRLEIEMLESAVVALEGVISQYRARYGVL